MSAACPPQQRQRFTTSRWLGVAVPTLLLISLLDTAALADSIATPTLTSFSLQQASLNHGDSIAIDYAATDVGPALRLVQLYYTDACGNGSYVTAQNSNGLPDTGTVTQLITNALRNGPYQLHWIIVEDLAYDQITYNRDGTWSSNAAGQPSQTGTHSFDFSTGDFSVGGVGTCTLSVANSSVASVSTSPAIATSVRRASVNALSLATGGTITSSPAGIDCGNVCSYDFPAGTTVTLIATPNASSQFAGWTGGCTGTSTTCSVVINADKSVSGSFEPATTNSYQLSVSKNGTGGGFVDSSPAGIACWGACIAQFDAGTVLVLTSTADATSVFTGWAGSGCAGTGTCQLAMSQARSVTATFDTSYRPDAMIGLARTGPFVGSGIFSTTGSDQTKTVRRSPRQDVTFFVKITNEGGATDAVVVLGRGQRQGFATHYFAGTDDITNQVIAGTYSKTLAAGASATIRLVVKVKSTTKIGVMKSWRILVASQGDGTLKDAVKGTVTVKG